MAPSSSSRGFTLIELVTIMILVGVLAVVALPKLNSAQDFGALAFRDRVATSLRYAQKSAVAKRRMVCATVAAGSLSLRVAETFGAASCDEADGGHPMSGPDGADPAAVSLSADVQLAPLGTLFFQPSGAITSNAAGTVSATGTITVTGQANINLRGTTGYVD